MRVLLLLLFISGPFSHIHTKLPNSFLLFTGQPLFIKGKMKIVCSNKPVNVSGANHKQNESKSLELTRNNNKKRT